jgi:hypothetical protein
VLKKDYALMARIVAVVMATIVISQSLAAKPHRYGDGQEYFLMSIAAMNHQSIDIRDEDIRFFFNESNGTRNAFGEKINPYIVSDVQVLYQARNGQWYSWHNPYYSELSAWILYLLYSTGNDYRMCFQIFNALLYSLVLFVIALGRVGLTQEKRLWAMLLFALSPVFWYIPWTHTEAYMCSLILLSLLFLNGKEYHLSIYCALFAAIQNYAALPILGYSLYKMPLDVKKKTRMLYLFVAFMLLAMPIMNLLSFGRITLLDGANQLKYLTLQHMYDTFFNFDYGLFKYYTLPVMLAGYCLFRYRKVKSLEYMLLGLLVVAITSTAGNFPSGHNGVIRYAMFQIPLVIMIVLEHRKDIAEDEWFIYFALAFIMLQLFWIQHFNWFMRSVMEQ